MVSVDRCFDYTPNVIRTRVKFVTKPMGNRKYDREFVLLVREWKKANEKIK